MNAKIKMKKIMKVKKLIKLGVLLAILGSSSNAMAFRCSTNGGSFVDQGSQDIYVTMTPQVQQNYNLIVDLSTKIICYNEDGPASSNYDWVVFTPGTVINSLPGSTKSIILDGNIYPSPLRNNTQPYGFPPGMARIPLPLSFVISPINNAGGGLISSGEKVAELNMYKTYPNPTGPAQLAFRWNIFSSTDVYIPTGGCDVSARNVDVRLPVYDTTGQTVPVPLTVTCPGAGAGTFDLSYVLTGNTLSTDPSIFQNLAVNPAQGIGIKMLDKNDNVITANNPVFLGAVGAAPFNLELKAAYAETGGAVSAGAVQSIIEVTFSYP